MSIETLVTSIKERRAILFVGAGVSMNLGLPSFQQLVSQIGKQLGFDSDIFHTLGDYLSLAEYYELERGGIGELRSWMDTTWHPATLDIRTSKVHELIVALSFPIIYTTNYDRWLEEAFKANSKAFSKVSSVGDLAKPRGGETEIVKFHGDFNNDDSIVLTESSYFSRMSFETPLDIKLRSDSLGRPLLFIGYSLGDMNMRYLLYKLHHLWEASSQKSHRPKSYILMTRTNPIQEKILEARGIEPIIWKNDNAGAGLEEFLSHLYKESSRV
jgi:hypothetical protein